MRVRVFVLAALLTFAIEGSAQTPCRRAVVEGEVKAGEGFSRKIGNGLAIGLDPLVSGWIVRVVPATGPRGDRDYAELATPPYESVNPLLISTDFSFRAQDAIGWNPRRFRFATTSASFAKLREAYLHVRGNGPHAFGQPFPGPGTPEQKRTAEQDLARRIGEAAEGTLQILDARLVAGTADQWVGAASVASHFDTTAHVAEQPSDGKATPLGKIVWIRFHISFDIPAEFRLEPGLKTETCAAKR